MDDYFIPLDVQAILETRVQAFQYRNIPRVSWRFASIARGKYIYLRRAMNDYSYQNLGRLTYSGDPENMPFAIYRYNKEKYDPKADFIGSQHLDGTIEGALKAILVAFP